MTPEKEDLAKLIESSMDLETRPRDIADAAKFSVAQTYRLFGRSGHGSPMKVLRRLRLERSAWSLTHTDQAITEMAFDAGYESLEGFSRAFRAAYGVSPRDYRRYAPSDYRLGLGGLHFWPDASRTPRQGETTLTLLDLLLNEHIDHMNRALDAYDQLTEEQRNLVVPGVNPLPWEAPDLSIAEMFSRNCGFGEPWIHMLDEMPESRNDGTVPSLRKQLQENDRRFRALAKKVEQEGTWDLTFVDSECEPPQVFSYGSVIVMQLVYTSHGRVVLEQQLRRFERPITFVE